MAVALRRGQPSGPASDQEIEEFVYDALDLLPGTSDVEVRSDGGRITLAGNVSQKRLKRDAGEIAWAIPGINDVNNTITIAPRRRTRLQGREGEQAAAPARKPA
jgi:osmotically-inducible protein OsmY